MFKESFDAHISPSEVHKIEQIKFPQLVIYMQIVRHPIYIGEYSSYLLNKKNSHE